MIVRQAKKTDISQITNILNEAIRWGKATAITKEVDEANRLDWFTNHNTGLYRAFVAEIEGNVIGYLSIGPYREGRQAFRHTAEVSYFVDFYHHRKGIAKALMEVCLKHCLQKEIKILLAFLMTHNEPSINFLLKYGFELWGTLPNSLLIDGKEYDHLIFGKRIIE